MKSLLIVLCFLPLFVACHSSKQLTASDPIKAYYTVRKGQEKAFAEAAIMAWDKYWGKDMTYSEAPHTFLKRDVVEWYTKLFKKDKLEPHIDSNPRSPYGREVYFDVMTEMKTYSVPISAVLKYIE